MKRSGKRVSMLIIFAIIASLMACGTSEQKDAQTAGTGGPQSPALPAYLNEKGYPVVKQPVTLKGIVSGNTNYVSFDKMAYFQKLEELTGVRLDVELITQNGPERFNLLFASQDFPDIAFAGPTDLQILNAAEARQVYSLDNLIKQYAPNWASFIEQNEYVRKGITMPDGHIYSLPCIDDTDYTAGLRDMWMINKAWMNELGITMPKNTDDFYKFLKAVKDNAGKGSIPKNAIPFYLRWNQYANGGAWEIFNAFGAFSGPDYIGVDTKTKKVYLSAVMPQMKEAVNYMHRLYSEKLVEPEMFTDDGTAQLAKMLSKPAIVGSYLYIRNHDEKDEIYTSLPPMTSPGNSTPMYRAQNNQISKNKFTIFSKCKYPEAAMRVADTMADPVWSMQARKGMIGHLVKDEGNGKYTQLPWGNTVLQNSAPDNAVPVITTNRWFNEHFIFTGSQGARTKAIKEVYSKYTMPSDALYPTTIVWKAEEQKRAGEIGVDLLDYINKTFADAIINGMSDGAFDAFVKKCGSIGLKEYLDIHQKQLDAYNAK